ncbi:MAG: hypothetical protein M1817_004348 [Caeruleum heppii]|nr:MAG: hypothetical protein M1817_004348 [Caeruleum heppii]
MTTHTQQSANTAATKPSRASGDPVSTTGRRTSIFKELGVGINGQDDFATSSSTTLPSAESRPTRRTSITDHDLDTKSSAMPTSPSSSISPPSPSDSPSHSPSWYHVLKSRLNSTFSRNKVVNSSTPPNAFPGVSHFALLIMLLALFIPGLQQTYSLGKARYSNGVSASVVRGRTNEGADKFSVQLSKRQDSPTDVCLRWSHQSAIVNGTLYLYGGQAKTSPTQTQNRWNNNLLSLPLDESFQIGSPTLKGLPQPSGPPPVANGYLWNSYSSLFLYGGLFSDSPATSPVPFSLWEYDIGSSSWKEHADPKTSAGTNSEPAGIPVQRSAEGAGFSVPELGRGWYFGGHLDGYTTPGWSQSTERVYIKSLIEYTFPGYSNDGVESLQGGEQAGPDGAWRNITQGGLQEAAGFTERADGLILYVPGFSEEGILIGLAGGTNVTFTQMNVIDVYDIATSTWYKQATSGETPDIRVNPCAVVAAAADGSSYNVHMYGGQNLIPYGSQEQYDDVWVLSIPSFSWIKVDTNGQSTPPARAGHTCNIWDGQMVVVGGYVGQDLSCDSPGVYVFDLSSLEWKTSFTSLQGSNAQNQQLSQQKESTGEEEFPGLIGSYGYQVPEAIRAVIGGDGNGGATITAPVQTATEGPIATGKAAVYTVTRDGATVTQTAVPGGGPAGSGASGSGGGTNVAAIVAGVVAGVFAMAAAYFAFCAWVYRRQLKLYKNHVAMSQRQAGEGQIGSEKAGYGGLLPQSSAGSSGNKHSTEASGGVSASSSAYRSLPQQAGGIGQTTGSEASASNEDLMAGTEPSFLGVLLSPRRSLRVINRD